MVQIKYTDGVDKVHRWCRESTQMLQRKYTDVVDSQLYQLTTQLYIDSADHDQTGERVLVTDYTLQQGLVVL